ncbi:hypothetical protein D3C80_1159560 [compost metagenome]
MRKSLTHLAADCERHRINGTGFRAIADSIFLTPLIGQLNGLATHRNTGTCSRVIDFEPSEIRIILGDARLRIDGKCCAFCIFCFDMIAIEIVAVGNLPVQQEPVVAILRYT